MERWRFFFFLTFLFASPLILADKFDPETSYSPGDWIKVRVKELHPTQFVIGKKEVEYHYDEVDEILAMDKTDRKHELKDMEKKVIIGPGGKLYLIEGHHHMRALYDRGAKWVFVKVAHDWSELSDKAFWDRMESHGKKNNRTHFYLRDENGKLRSYKDLPANLGGMKDDPYRSLVFFLTKLGILRKNDARFPLYGEFEIVEYLRSRVPIRSESGRLRFEPALKEAAYLLTDRKNQHLDFPGQVRMSEENCALALQKIGKWL